MTLMSHTREVSVRKKGRWRAAAGCASAAALLLSGLGTSVAQAAPPQKDKVYYASPDGRDHGQCQEKHPCSLEHVQGVVRHAAAKGKGDVTVVLADGTYRIDHPLEFRAQDGGRDGHTVRWTAAEGAHPEISGSTQLSGWEQYDEAANIYGSRFRSSIGSASGGTRRSPPLGLVGLLDRHRRRTRRGLMTRISMQVDDVRYEDEVEPRLLLVHYLRERLGKIGTVVGCDTSSCGACTVELDGQSVKSCAVLAVQADGSTITTIEGLERDGVLDPVQQAFHEQHALQCGFCTPGMIMAARALLRENPTRPTRRRGRHRGKPLPVHRLPEHRQGDPGCGQRRRRARARGGRRGDRSRA